MAIRRLVCTCLALVTVFSAQIPARAGEVLHNGIELPDDWPPARTLEELRSGRPMAVPYLKSPPAPIPIDVGRQLFLDDFLVESTTLKRVFHKPVQHEANPILRPTKRWEVAFDPHSAMCFSDGVFFDPRDGYHFDRPYREAVMTVADDPSAWNYGNVQSVAGGGVIVGDRVYMYASGCDSASASGTGHSTRSGSLPMSRAQAMATSPPEAPASPARPTPKGSKRINLSEGPSEIPRNGTICVFIG